MIKMRTYNIPSSSYLHQLTEQREKGEEEETDANHNLQIFKISLRIIIKDTNKMFKNTCHYKQDLLNACLGKGRNAVYVNPLLSAVY